MKTSALGWALAALLFAAGCSTVPETGRMQLNLISAEQEKELGMAAFRETRKELPVSKNRENNALVDRVGRRIAQVAELPGAEWEFVLFESKEANAFCLPGGKVGVFSGILPLAKNEAGLATIIGHEIAHAVARHGAERISQSILFQSGGELLAAGLGQSEMSPQVRELVGAVYGIGVQVGGELPHGRRQELEADRIGMIYMARAGYDPREAIAFWERFQEFNQRTSGQVPALLRTHPVDSVRMEQLRRYLPEALEEYRRARP